MGADTVRSAAAVTDVVVHERTPFGEIAAP